MLIRTTGRACSGVAAVGLAPPFGSIVTMPKAGGVAPTTLGAGRTLPDRTHAIASDGANVYWADVGATQPSSSSVYAIEKSPTATPRVLVAGLTSPVAIAVDASALYVAEWGDDTNGGRVFSATLDAGPVLADVVVTPARVGPNEVHLTLSKRTGGPAGALNVTVQFALPAKGISPIDVTMRRAGVDHYISTGLTLPFAGDWQMTLKVLTDPVTEEVATSTVTIR